MTDINSNFGGDVSKTNGINVDRTSPLPSYEPVSSAAAGKEISNLDHAHSALVGRSMVKPYTPTPNFDGEIVKAVKKDLADLDANYAKNKKSVALEDLALEKGIPYDKAMKMGEEFRS